jgi:hypothetical protein
MKTQMAVNSLLEKVGPIKTGQEQVNNELEKRTEYEVRNIERCTVVQYCWWRPPEKIEELVAKLALPTSSPLNLPGGFLWRSMASHGASPKGVLRTSQQFLRFLRDVWLDAIYKNVVGDRLFVPEYFFKSELECLAFKKHMDSFKKGGP